MLAIVPESLLTLRSRDFLKGDVVKRSLTNIESATIVDITAEAKLEHAITKEPVDAWVPWNLLGNSMIIEARDKVVFDEWLGTVEEVSRPPQPAGPDLSMTPGEIPGSRLIIGLRRWLGGRTDGWDVSAGRDGRGARTWTDGLGESSFRGCRLRVATLSLRSNIPGDATEGSCRLPLA